MAKRIIKIFLRLALSLGFISACLDRFGIFWKMHLAWGNWNSFVDYVGKLLPWLNDPLISAAAIISTGAELGLGVLLLLGWKLRIVANLSGILLLLFALAMTFSTGLKTAFDASVYAASAGAFALATMRDKVLEIA